MENGEWWKNKMDNGEWIMIMQQENAPKGQRANSPGQRPGYKDVIRFALKGQQPYLAFHAFALTGRELRTTFTQGVALGCELTGLSGRCCPTCEA